MADANALRDRSEQRRARSAAELSGVLGWQPERDKRAGWLLEDEADDLQRQAEMKLLFAEQQLHNALSHTPGLLEAHQELAIFYERAHREAEERQDESGVARYRVHLRAHVDKLPDDELKRRLLEYLDGAGRVVFETDPLAEVSLHRLVSRNRRLIPAKLRELGSAARHDFELEMGSYLLIVEREGFTSARFPVFIGRQEEWHGVRPGDDATFPIELLSAEAIGADDVYIPAGWFIAGGDAEAPGSPRRRRVWVDGFVMKRHPVTHREYLEFLNDALQSDEPLALSCAPRNRAASVGEEGGGVYLRDAAGRFLMPEGDEQLERFGGGVTLDHPVTMVSWFSAAAYARWLAERTGLGWRLPVNLEWEKAGRGVDGRFFPWGDAFDPSWCQMRESSADALWPVPVGDFAGDESIYGVRGLAGNTCDWCADSFQPMDSGGEIALIPEPRENIDDTESFRVARGGSFYYPARRCRLARRDRDRPEHCYANVGFRVARSLR